MEGLATAELHQASTGFVWVAKAGFIVMIVALSLLMLLVLYMVWRKFKPKDAEKAF